MSDIDTDLTFKGRGGLSCEEFVKAVRRHAVTAMKSRDNEYIADYAMSWLSGDALHWSEKLSEDVQGDWPLLRRALLAKYGSPSQDDGNATAIIPVPAAAPPVQPSVSTYPTPASPIIRGRIQVVGRTFKGYLSKRLDNRSSGKYWEHFKWCCLATKDASDACVLSGTLIDGGLQFKFEDLNPLISHIGTHLGMVWYSVNSLNPYAAITTIDIKSSTVMSLKAPLWDGPASWVTWIRSPDNTLTPKLENLPDAGIAISNAYTKSADYLIEIFADVDDYTKGSGMWEKARFVFEPI